ncbi:MAG: hypothetical protein QM791_00495 [Ferruginibacter sp.]
MRKILLILFVAGIKLVSAQSVGIGTNSPVSSAVLDISSNNKGLLMPRLSSTQRKAIVSPANGLIVFDNNTSSYWYFSNGNWKEISGNSITTDSVLTVGQQAGSLVSYNINSALSGYSDTSAYIYDSGGPSGPYGNNEDYTRYISGYNYNSLLVKVTVMEMDVENLYDSLILFVPNGDSVKLTGSQTGTWYFNATQLFVRFKSNALNPSAYKGFKIRYDIIYAPKDDPAPTPRTGWVYIPSKVAVRGGAAANEWNRDSVGMFSFGYGRAVKGSGFAAVAMGDRSVASGLTAVAIGEKALATGDNSTAIGYFVTSNSTNAVTVGSNSHATGINSMALGSNSNAIGFGAVAIAGGNATNSGIAIGSGAYAVNGGVAILGTSYSGSLLSAGGESVGLNSIALGYATKAKAFSSIALGSWNDSIAGSNNNEWVSTDPLLYVGNGTPGAGARSNAMLILKNGNIGIGTNTPTAKLEVNGFTSLGATADGAPHIKMKKLTGTLPPAASPNTFQFIPTGIVPSKILSVNALVTDGIYQFLPHSTQVGYLYTVNVDNGNIAVGVQSTTLSGSVMNKPVKIIVIYEE